MNQALIKDQSDASYLLNRLDWWTYSRSQPRNLACPSVSLLSAVALSISRYGSTTTMPAQLRISSLPLNWWNIRRTSWLGCELYVSKLIFTIKSASHVSNASSFERRDRQWADSEVTYETSLSLVAVDILTVMLYSCDWWKLEWRDEMWLLMEEKFISSEETLIVWERLECFEVSGSSIPFRALTSNAITDSSGRINNYFGCEVNEQCLEKFSHCTRLHLL